MHRKPLLESLSESIERNFSLVLAVVVGVISLVYFAHRRRVGPPPPPQPATRTAAAVDGTGSERQGLAASQGDIVKSFVEQKFRGSKICVTWEVLEDKGQFGERGQEVAQWLSANSEVFFMCRVPDEAEKRRLLQQFRPLAERGLERKRVLFCTTAKGYEAFTRQVNPVLLITHDASQARFLSRVLPYIIYVGTSSVDCPNVQTIGSIAELAST